MNKCFIALCTLIMVNSVWAVNIRCGGKVTNAYIDSSKNVIIKGTWRNDNTRICSTGGRHGVDTVTCSLWFSTVTTSMVHDKEVLLMYSDQNGAMSCSNIAKYADAPTPTYVMLIK